MKTSTVAILAGATSIVAISLSGLYAAALKADRANHTFGTNPNKTEVTNSTTSEPVRLSEEGCGSNKICRAIVHGMPSHRHTP